jgi:hypothetical protein
LILTTILTLGQRVLEKRFGRGFGASVPARNAKINFRERLAGA